MQSISTTQKPQLKLWTRMVGCAPATLSTLMWMGTCTLWTGLRSSSSTKPIRYETISFPIRLAPRETTIIFQDKLLAISQTSICREIGNKFHVSMQVLSQKMPIQLNLGLDFLYNSTEYIILNTFSSS